MTTNRFASARGKLERAEAHRLVLEPEVKAFATSEPVVFCSKTNLMSRITPIVCSYFVERVTPPPTTWAPIAGDAIQNLRAALDHAVWEIVVAEKGLAFAEARAPQIDFPIAESARSFPAKRLAKIGLSSATIAVIESFQPYIRTAQAPRHDVLWLIRCLSNVDKHRLLHVISMVGEGALIQTDPPLPGGKAEWIAKRGLRQGDEVVRFTVPRLAIYADIAIRARFEIGISIEETSETGSIALDLGLRAMRDRVAQVVDAL